MTPELNFLKVVGLQFSRFPRPSQSLSGKLTHTNPRAGNDSPLRGSARAGGGRVASERAGGGGRRMCGRRAGGRWAGGQADGS